MRHFFRHFCLAGAMLAASAALHAQTAPDQSLEIPVLIRPPLVQISGNTEICEGSETVLKAEGDFESFKWNTGEDTRYLKVRKAGIYEVTVTTKAGCTYTSSVNVRSKPCL